MAEIIRDPKTGRVLFTEEMKEEYTILAPMMAPIHFSMFEQIFASEGYKVKMLTSTNDAIKDIGLQNVHNDTCYPALLVVGQMLEALQSGEYDTNKVALFMTQTGGGCRASNYIHLIRRALKRNGLEHIPVLSFNMVGMEKNPGFKITPKLMLKLFFAIHYGDALMLLSNQTRPYEKNKGETDALIKKWTDYLNGSIRIFLKLGKNLKQMVRDFADIELTGEKNVKVGIVGEIYVKYAPLGNNNLADFLESEDVEVIIPSLLDFFLYSINHRVEDREMLGIKKFSQFFSMIAEKAMVHLQNQLVKIVKKNSDFRPCAQFYETKKLVKGYVSPANKMGEGWLLTGEMLELIHSGIPNVICTQPFGCLPNHIVGKGMIRKIREENPGANIVAIDYDPGATKINQENRIKLMLSVARDAMLGADAPEELFNAPPVDITEMGVEAK